MSVEAERLQKVIAQSGLTSRRKAEQYIVDGKVKVNGEIVTTLGTKVFPKDKIEVNNIPLEKERIVYFALNKPRGVISSVSDDKNRKTVIHLLPEVTERIYPIGRLDYDSSGLILLTNDGDFANRLMHPKHMVEKVYVAKLKGIPSKIELIRLRKGIRSEGDLLKVIRYKIIAIDKQKNTTMIEIVLHEGKNRHVRRMMETLGYPVQKLTRERYGVITLDGLQSGASRTLTPNEVHQLMNQSAK